MSFVLVCASVLGQAVDPCDPMPQPLVPSPIMSGQFLLPFPHTIGGAYLPRPGSPGVCNVKGCTLDFDLVVTLEVPPGTVLDALEVCVGFPTFLPPLACGKFATTPLPFPQNGVSFGANNIKMHPACGERLEWTVRQTIAMPVPLLPITLTLAKLVQGCAGC